MRRRTLRGQVEEGVVKRLVVDDGQLYQGFKVIDFVISGDPSSLGNDAYATLGLQYDTPLVWNWGDNRQIAWASTNVAQTASLDSAISIIDPDHVVLRDLYIQGQVSGSGGSSVINYMVVLEPVFLSDDEAIITLIKERSQDDIR
jgi:hypothetical protein